MKGSSLILGAVVLLAVTPAWTSGPARSSYTAPSGTTYAVSRGAVGLGSCGPVTGGYECALNGSVVVSVSDTSGCGAVTAPASCTVVLSGGATYPAGTSTLECESQNYEVSDGGTGTCTANNGNEMSCTQEGTSNFASATCQSGCGTVSGTGKCTPKPKP